MSVSSPLVSPLLAPACADSDDAVGLRFTRRNLLLLAKVQRSAKDMAAAIASLENALSVQTKLLALARRGDAGSAAVVDSERQEAAKLCLELGSACEAATPARDDAAREYYTTGLRHADDYSPLYLALARLHLRRGEIEECRAMGTAVTTRDPNNQDVSAGFARMPMHLAAACMLTLPT